MCDSDGVTISASDVDFDTAGHTISEIFAAVRITDGVSHVRINGGGTLISGNGLIVGNASDISVDNLNITGDSDLGGDGAAIEINGATGVKVTDSTLTAVCGGSGITGNVDRGVFLNNTITGSCSAFQGIALGGTNNVIRRNTMTMVNNGIILAGSNNVVRNNTITMLNSAGVLMYAISVTSRTVVKANTIELPGGGRSVSISWATPTRSRETQSREAP